MHCIICIVSYALYHMHCIYALYVFYALYSYPEGVELTLKLVGDGPTDRPTDGHCPA